MPPFSAGSPTSSANTNAASPATRPATMPRTSNVRTMSVAGEAEQVPAVVQELVDQLAGEHRGGALVHADQVQQRQQHDPGEHGPRGELAQRDRGEPGPGQRAGTG